MEGVGRSDRSWCAIWDGSSSFVVSDSCAAVLSMSVGDGDGEDEDEDEVVEKEEDAEGRGNEVSDASVLTDTGIEEVLVCGG